MNDYIDLNDEKIRAGDECQAAAWLPVARGHIDSNSSTWELLKFRRPVPVEEVCASEEYALSLDETETVIHPKADEWSVESALGLGKPVADKPQDDNGDAKRAELTESAQEMGDYDVPQEWSGGVCPEIGTECECSNHGGEWERCVIRYNGPGLIVVDHKNYTDQHYHKGNITFRPIKSVAEVEAEADRNHATFRAFKILDEKVDRALLEKLYDEGFLTEPE